MGRLLLVEFAAVVIGVTMIKLTSVYDVDWGVFMFAGLNSNLQEILQFKTLHLRRAIST